MVESKVTIECHQPRSIQIITIELIHQDRENMPKLLLRTSLSVGICPPYWLEQLLGSETPQSQQPSCPPYWLGLLSFNTSWLNQK